MSSDKYTHLCNLTNESRYDIFPPQKFHYASSRQSMLQPHTTGHHLLISSTKFLPVAGFHINGIIKDLIYPFNCIYPFSG